VHEAGITKWRERELLKGGETDVRQSMPVYRSPETPTLFHYHALDGENAKEMLLVTVGAVKRPPLCYCLCEVRENLFCIFPVDAGICDGDTVLETWRLC
jgi:hypothetical protein